MRTPRTLVATLVAVALLAFGGSTASAETRAEDTPIAIANGDLVDAEGTQVGQVLTIDDGETALWFVAAEGLSPGLHGLQLRQTGDCGSDFADTGARITGTRLATLDATDGSLAQAEFTTSSDNIAALADDDGFALVVTELPDNRGNIPTRYQSTASSDVGADVETSLTGDVGNSVACAVMDTMTDVSPNVAAQAHTAWTGEAAAILGTSLHASEAASGPDLDFVQADLVDAEGGRHGRIRLVTGLEPTDASQGIITGLDRGVYGVQIHGSGSCTGSGFSGTGPRVDGTDLPELTISGPGRGEGFNLSSVSLPSLTGLLSGDGASIVVHTKASNHANVPTRYTATGAPDPGPDATTLATGDVGAGILCGKLRAVPAYERYIDTIYSTLLSRGVEPQSVPGWTTYLHQHTRASFVSTVMKTLEARREFVTEQYLMNLGVPPDPTGRDYWAAQMAKPSFNEDSLLATLIGSGRYYFNAGGTDTDFIADVFDYLLFREPSSGERTIWRTYLQRGGSRSAMVASLLATTEGRAIRIVTEYEMTVVREPEIGEVALWLEYLRRGGRFPALRVTLLASREFYDEAVSTPFFSAQIL